MLPPDNRAPAAAIARRRRLRESPVRRLWFRGVLCTSASRQPYRRTLMGIRIVLADKEPINAALRRFKKLLERSGLTRDLRRQESFQKPTEIRRRKRFKKWFKARLATLVAQTDGKQPVASMVEVHKAFWKKTGKP